MTALDRPNCRNVRDVGGGLVRSDSTHRLTAEGLARLRAYGVRRVIDLRANGVTAGQLSAARARLVA